MAILEYDFRNLDIVFAPLSLKQYLEEKVKGSFKGMWYKNLALQFEYNSHLQSYC